VSLGDIIAASALGLTILSLLVGAAWWMSALYMEVRGIKRTGERMEQRFYEHRKEHDTLWDGHRKHEDRIDDHESRISRVETG